MPYHFMPGRMKKNHKTYSKLMLPINETLPNLTPLKSNCNRPLQMSFEDQVNILVYFHLEEHHSGLREICINIRNEMSLEDIVNDSGVWFYQPPGSKGIYATS